MSACSTTELTSPIENRSMLLNNWPLGGDLELILEARLPGTGKDGGPSCATVHPIQDWMCRRD